MKRKGLLKYISTGKTIRVMCLNAATIYLPREWQGHLLATLPLGSVDAGRAGFFLSKEEKGNVPKKVGIVLNLPNIK